MTLPTDYPLGFNNQIGYLHKGLGSKLQGKEYRRSLDIPQDILSHQLPGVACSILALKSFALHQKSVTILLRLDVTAIAFLNKLGGTHSQLLLSLALEIWNWCIDYYTCRAPSRKIQCQSRLGITTHHQLNAPSGDLSSAAD